MSSTRPPSPRASDDVATPRSAYFNKLVQGPTLANAKVLIDGEILRIGTTEECAAIRGITTKRRILRIARWNKESTGLHPVAGSCTGAHGEAHTSVACGSAWRDSLKDLRKMYSIAVGVNTSRAVIRSSETFDRSLALTPASSAEVPDTASSQDQAVPRWGCASQIGAHSNASPNLAGTLAELDSTCG
ncbi:hypothetical protein FB451DRAFT_1195167 [Mycena latifolia]|nr:hypothetical protein FB451DRAFT_1195167 [Mycena latifolia]